MPPNTCPCSRGSPAVGVNTSVSSVSLTGSVCVCDLRNVMTQTLSNLALDTVCACARKCECCTNPELHGLSPCTSPGAPTSSVSGDGIKPRTRLRPRALLTRNSVNLQTANKVQLRVASSLGAFASMESPGAGGSLCSTWATDPGIGVGPSPPRRLIRSKPLRRFLDFVVLVLFPVLRIEPGPRHGATR